MRHSSRTSLLPIDVVTSVQYKVPVWLTSRINAPVNTACESVRTGNLKKMGAVKRFVQRQEATGHKNSILASNQAPPVGIQSHPII